MCESQFINEDFLKRYISIESLFNKKVHFYTRNHEKMHILISYQESPFMYTVNHEINASPN